MAMQIMHASQFHELTELVLKKSFEIIFDVNASYFNANYLNLSLVHGPLTLIIVLSSYVKSFLIQVPTVALHYQNDICVNRFMHFYYTSLSYVKLHTFYHFLNYTFCCMVNYTRLYYSYFT